jgi:hypothetical protein
VPAEISCSDELIQDYFVVVATRAIRGLDHEKSSYKRVPGTQSILRFNQAVYKEGCLGLYDAARDQEFLSNLLISDRLSVSLKGLNGLGIYEPSEMNWST